MENVAVIQTRSLRKSFGNVQALKGVDLDVYRHSIFGFLGPNGAGKTTLMKTLLGLIRPTSGSAKIFGMDIVKESVAIRERVGYLPQQPRFIDYMTARENLFFVAKFFFHGPDSSIAERCDEMLNLVGLAEKADRPVKGFSGGEKQRLGIALAQVNYPDLLILDEPASALDPLGRQSVLEIMNRLKKHTTIFYSTHILDDVQRVSDTVAILNRGQVVASGPIGQILNGKDGVIYSLTVRGDPAGVGECLAALPWVKQASTSRHKDLTTWHVSVEDENAAESGLLREVLVDPEVVVTDFSRKKYELEEVFMEIVKGESDER
ncbi:MAG TPA: ABC transporter ATP-binding protein [Anaerolineales bacterium]|nr:ABC transporter ATP-binding protein [Anaerolineales bacterium]